MYSEFGLIDQLRDKYGLSSVGDDAAVLPKDERHDLVVTTDLLVEDVDFRLAWAPPEMIGHKALAVSLSDVAAMGAAPVWSLISIGLPERVWRTDFAERFYAGYMELAESLGVTLVGGDVSRTPERIVVDSIAAGETERGRAVLRSGARPGDVICVSGSLGGARAGLTLLEKGFRHGEKGQDPAIPELLLRQLRPQPRDGRRLAGTATSMIDLSDGLAGDLRHICRASGVGARLFADKIPYDKNLPRLTAGHLKAVFPTDPDPVRFALAGGEDFELLFTVRPGDAERLKGSLPYDLTPIGEITDDPEIIELVENGKSRPLDVDSHEHF